MNSIRRKALILTVVLFSLISLNAYCWEMYVSNESSSSITVYDQAGVLLTTITDPSIAQPRGLVFRENGNLYVACGSSKIVIIDESHTVIGSINTPGQGAGLALGSNNHLYVGISNNEPNNIVREYDENDNFVRSFSGSLNPFKPDVMNIGPNGNLFVDSYGLVEFDLSGNLIKYLPNNSTYTYGLGVVAAPDGLLYVVRHNLVTSQAEMVGLEPSTFEVKKSFSLGSDRWIYGITFDSESYHFFITLFTLNIIEEYALTGEFLGSFISGSGLSGPVNIAIKSTGIDTDGDGIIDSEDNCPNVSNADQLNSDGDSHGDACDNCPYADNEDQMDSDGNGIGDVCESPLNQALKAVANAIALENEAKAKLVNSQSELDNALSKLSEAWSGGELEGIPMGDILRAWLSLVSAKQFDGQAINSINKAISSKQNAKSKLEK